LKLLEEPPDDTTVVVTSAHPGGLLPTILSRVLAIRAAPIAPEEVQAYLIEELGTAADEAERVAGMARGAIGRALRLLTAGDEIGALAAARKTGRDWLFAALSTDSVMRLAEVSAQKPVGSRGAFSGNLEALAEWLRDL